MLYWRRWDKKTCKTNTRLKPRTTRSYMVHLPITRRRFHYTKRCRQHQNKRQAPAKFANHARICRFATFRRSEPRSKFIDTAWRGYSTFNNQWHGSRTHATTATCLNHSIVLFHSCDPKSCYIRHLMQTRDGFEWSPPIMFTVVSSISARLWYSPFPRCYLQSSGWLFSVVSSSRP